MGYRSQVTSIIYGEAEKIDLFLVKHKILDSEALKEFKNDIEVVERDTSGHLGTHPKEKGILFEGDWLKWYPEYPDVKAWNELLRDAEEFGLYFELMRVGEEAGDVEHVTSAECDWVLNVNTTIDNSF
jgi:hypothetical protein